jgi:hypothetical protein
MDACEPDPSRAEREDFHCLFSFLSVGLQLPLKFFKRAEFPDEKGIRTIYLM